MYVSAIVLAGGLGLRFSRPDSFTVGGGIPTHKSKMIESGKSKIPKPLIKINSKPIIIHCLDTLSKHPYIKDIILVVNTKNSRSIISKIRQYHIGKIRQVVKGGRRRQDSVINGLNAIDGRTDLVLIHDAVRPFIDKETLSSVIKEAKRCGAAIVGVPVKATIKQVSSLKSQVLGRYVEKTLNRDALWEIQTPQVFKKNLILKAYNKFGNLIVTDDSMLVEKLGIKVRVVLGSYNNIKITTPEDLIIAQAILRTL